MATNKENEIVLDEYQKNEVTGTMPPPDDGMC